MRMAPWRRLARRIRRLLRPRALPDHLTPDQLPDALADAASPAEVRALVARVHPVGAHAWPAVARYAPEFDLPLIDRILDEDAASAPDLARNPNLSAAQYAHLASWAAERLAREAASPEAQFLAPAPLTLQRLAEAGHLRFDGPAGRSLMAVGRQSSDLHHTHADRDARRILLQIRGLGSNDLVTLTDVCRADEEALLAIARHSAANHAVWQAILVATPRASTAERLAEVPGIRRDPLLRRLLHRRYADAPALLESLASDAVGEEFQALWLDLVRADRDRAARLLTSATDAQIGALARRDLVPLLRSTSPTQQDAAMQTFRRLGIDPSAGAGETSGERRAG